MDLKKDEDGYIYCGAGSIKHIYLFYVKLTSTTKSLLLPVQKYTIRLCWFEQVIVCSRAV